MGGATGTPHARTRPTHRPPREPVPLHERLLLLRRLALEAVPEERQLLLQEPAPVLLGHRVGEAEDVVTDHVLPREALVGGGPDTLAQELANATLELGALDAAAACGVDALEHCISRRAVARRRRGGSQAHTRTLKSVECRHLEVLER